MDDLKQLLAMAQRALAEGNRTPEEVDAIIARRAGVEDITDFRSLESYVTRADAAAHEQGPLEAGVRGFADMASFGLADELAGGARGLLAMIPGGDSPGEAYRRERDVTRGALAGAREQQPIASTAGSVAGAFVPGAAPFRGVGALGRAAARTIPGAGRAGNAAVSGVNAGARAVAQLPGISRMPGAGRMAEGLLGPGGTLAPRALQALPGGATTIPRSLAVNVPASAGIGAAEGLAYGLGSQEGSLLDRVNADVGTETAVGTVAGGTLGTLGALWRVGRQRVSRKQIAEALENLHPGSPRSGEGVPNAAARHAQDIADVSDRLWKPLEKNFPEVTNERIFKTIRESRELAATARRVLDSEVYEYVMRGPGTGRKPPSLVDLQEVASNVNVRTSDAFSRRRTKAAADELHTVMGDQLEGYKPAREAYAAARAAERAYADGWDGFTQPVDVLTDQLKKLPEPQRRAFRTGLAARYAHKLRSGGQMTRNDIVRLEDAGLRDVVFMMFEDPKVAHTFINQAKKLGQADASGRRARSALRQLGFGTAIAAGAFLGSRAAGGDLSPAGLLDTAFGQ